LRAHATRHRPLASLEETVPGVAANEVSGHR
jgi:hypothetical protein